MQEDNSNTSFNQLNKRKENPYKIQRGKILCNYFPLKITKQIENIYVFNIEMTPHITFEKLALRTRILSMLQNQFSRIITKPIISGMNIYSHSEPKLNQKMFQSGEYRIFVKLSKVVNVKLNPNLFVYIMDSIIRSLMIKKSYNILCKSKKYFDMKKKVQHYAVNVYSGFHVDFIKAQSLYFLRIDCSRKIVCSQTALEAIQYCYKICKQRDREERRKFIKQKMIGRTVMANYGKNRFQKIKDITFQSVQFQRLDDKPLTQYFQSKYGIEVRNLGQPLLVIQNKKLAKENQNCYLVPELCFMVGLPEDIDEVKQRNILAAIKLQPQQIRNESTFLMADIIQEVDEWKSLQKLGVVLESKEMPLIQCKKFPKPVLQLGSNLKVQRGLQSLFNIACRPIYKGNRPVKCSVLYFNRADINYLYGILQKNSKDIGVNIQFNKLDMGELNNNKALLQVEMGIIEACKQQKSNIVFIVLPNGLKTYYRKIKKFCLIDHKIISQIICESILPHRHSINIFGKILLQILAKCGNILWIPKQVLESEKKIMLLAYQTGRAGTEVVVSTCCTADASYYVAYSKFGFANQNSQRSAELLEVMIKNAIDCLEYYNEKNGQLPDEVIFISKAGSISVAENKFKAKFVSQLKKQVKQYFSNKKFCISYILIETKDNTKFFIHQNPYTKSRNAETGTVVDQKITKNNEFFLITQATPGVSATPIKFKIIQSDSKLQRTLLQQLLFNQCFCYANFTGLVQTPAILQYAKKLAKFVSEAPFEEKLDRKIQQIPYYL